MGQTQLEEEEDFEFEMNINKWFQKRMEAEKRMRLTHTEDVAEKRMLMAFIWSSKG